MLELVLSMASCDILPESITSILGIGSNDNGQNDGNDAPYDNTSNSENNNDSNNGSKDEFLLIEISDAKLKSTQVWYYSEVKVSGCWHYNDAGSPMPW